MAIDRSKELTTVAFHCRECKRSFSAAPERVEDAPEREWHPWAYFACCPDCGEEVEQASHERALLKAWAHATGPRTPEGIAATAANLEGHPTPEETRRTRFNAMKHGLTARVATFFPSKPDKYSHCTTCEVDRDWCREQPCCVKQTELFMRFAAAFEVRNPKALLSLFSDQQAGLFAIVQQMMQSILADGVTLRTPQYQMVDGEVVLAEYYDDDGQRRIIHDLEAHPLLGKLAEFVSKANLNLADMGMTMRQVEEEQQAQGVLQSQGQAREQLVDFMGQQAKSLEALKGLLQNAQASRERDPVLLEYRQNGGDA